MKRILFISLDAKEAIQGCGATITKLSIEGNKLYYFSIRTKTEDKSPLSISSRLLGIEGDCVIMTDEPPGYEALLENLNRAILPDVVFIPSAQIGRRYVETYETAKEVFKHCNLFAYELPVNNFQFVASCFSSVTEKQVEKKIMAVSEFMITSELIRPLAKVRGVQINEPYAEAFEVIKLRL